MINIPQMNNIYKKLYEELKYDCMILCNEITVKSENEAKLLFKIINNVIPIPDMPEGIDLASVHTITSYFVNKYPGIFSSNKSGKCFRPFLHRNTFQEKIGQLVDSLEKKGKVDSTLIIQKLEQYNEELKTKQWQYFVSSSHDTSISINNYLKKAKDKGHFLIGMFGNYKWLFHLFDIFNLTNKFRTYKESLTNEQKQEIWNRCMSDKTGLSDKTGTSNKTGLCPICQESEICFNDVLFCQDMSESKETSINLDSLFILCHKCNKTIGSKLFYKMWQDFQAKYNQ